MKFIFEVTIMALLFYVIPMTVIELIALEPDLGIVGHWITLVNIITYAAVVSAEFALLKAAQGK
jgi:hypothetical protein